MAWFADRAKNLLSRGKAAESDDSAKVTAPSPAKASYDETGLTLPLESGHTAFLDGALEQVQADAEIWAVLEKVGIPEISADDSAAEAAADSSRGHGAELAEEEHRLLTAFVLLGNGDAKFRGGYYTSAEASYREAQKAVSATREKTLQAICLSSLGAALGMQGKHDQAMKLVEDALRRKPELAEAWYNKGMALLLFPRYEEALPCFDEALVHKPELAQAWYNKGIALGNLGRFEEALPCFTEALGRDLQDADAWLGKGAAQLMLGRNEEAVASLDQALSTRPEFAEAWLGRGQALGNMGRHEDAASCFEKALLHKPELAHAWHNKGVALERLGWYKQALAAHERARSLEKGRP